MFAQVRELFVKVLNVDAERIQLETRLNEDLGIDSMDMYNLIDILEENFKINILELSNISTVGDIVDLINEKIDNK